MEYLLYREECRHLCLTYMVQGTPVPFNMELSCWKEESILVSVIKKTSIFLLTIVTNESYLFRIELMLKWRDIFENILWI